MEEKNEVFSTDRELKDLSTSILNERNNISEGVFRINTEVTYISEKHLVYAAWHKEPKDIERTDLTSEGLRLLKEAPILILDKRIKPYGYKLLKSRF